MTATGPTTGLANNTRKARPFGLFEWMVARRYIGATRRGGGVSLISIIAFIGIALSVMTLIVVMSIMNGFRGQLLDQLLGINGHAFVTSEFGGPIEDYEGLLANIEATPGVTVAFPQINAPVYATSANNETGAVVRGIRPDDIRSIDLIAGEGHLWNGGLENFGAGRKGGNEIAIGIGFAGTLGVTIGDKVTLMTGNGPSTPFGTTPRTKAYYVAAIYRVGNTEFDDYGLYMPLEQAQLFFRRKGVDVIEVQVEKPQKIDDYIESLEAAGMGIRVRSWKQRHAAYFGALQTERFMLMIILLFLVALTTLNIITGLVMLVKDKRADIAVMRTLGATQNSIMRIFFMSGSLIGVLGTLLGVGLGVLFCTFINPIETGLSKLVGKDLFPAEIYMLDGLPAKINPTEVAFTAGFAILMSFLATIYPSWRAAKLDPVEALRYE